MCAICAFPHFDKLRENNLEGGKMDDGLWQHEVWSQSSWIRGGTDHPAKKDSVQQRWSPHSLWALETDRTGRGSRFLQGMPSFVPYRPQTPSY